MREDLPELDLRPSPLADPDVVAAIQRVVLEMELSRLDCG